MIKTLVLKCIIILFIVLHAENGGDLIQFVQDYFNLSFIDAIKKISSDFNLNLNCGKLSKEQIEQIKKRKKRKEEKKQEHYDKLLIICKTLKILEQTKKDLKSQITPYNWEELEYKCSILTNEIELLNEEFDKLNVKKY